jgi:mRNA interferase MazF
MNTFPRRGEIWLINWNPARGSEQAGIRPALVIQNNIGNEHASTTIVAAISTAVKSYPMNVLLDPPQGGLIKPSIIKTSQILTVLKDRLEKKLGVVEEKKMKEVDQALKISLSL